MFLSNFRRDEMLAAVHFLSAYLKSFFGLWSSVFGAASVGNEARRNFLVIRIRKLYASGYINISPED